MHPTESKQALEKNAIMSHKWIEHVDWGYHPTVSKMAVPDAKINSVGTIIYKETQISEMQKVSPLMKERG